MKHEDFLKLMKKARLTNIQRDKVERAYGFAPPDDVAFGVFLATAIEAIRAGVKMSNWNAVAEGLAMLEDDPRVKEIVKQ